MDEPACEHFVECYFSDWTLVMLLRRVMKRVLVQTLAHPVQSIWVNETQVREMTDREEVLRKNDVSASLFVSLVLLFAMYHVFNVAMLIVGCPGTCERTQL